MLIGPDDLRLSQVIFRQLTQLRGTEYTPQQVLLVVVLDERHEIFGRSLEAIAHMHFLVACVHVWVDQGDVVFEDPHVLPEELLLLVHHVVDFNRGVDLWSHWRQLGRLRLLRFIRLRLVVEIIALRYGGVKGIFLEAQPRVRELLERLN